MTNTKNGDAKLEPWMDLCADLLINAIPVIVYRIKMQPTMHFEFVSDSVLEMTGYSPQEHYDDPDLGAKLVFEQDRDLLGRLLSQRTNAPIILRWVRKDGKLIWTQTFLFYSTDDEGQLESITGLAIDITQRMREEQLIYESLSVLEAATELDKMGGWEWDIESQKMFWTHEVYVIHDFPEPFDIDVGQEIIDKSLACYPPEARMIVNSAFRRCCEEGVPYDLEVPFISLNNRTLWVRTLGRAVSENGKIIKVVGNFSDITERKESELALGKSEERLRNLFDGMMEGFAQHEMIFNDQGEGIDYRFIKVNPAFEAMTGLKAKEIEGKTVLEVLPQTEKYWIERYAKVVKTGKRDVFEDYSSELGRHYRVVAYNSSPGTFSVFIHDVTDIYKARAELLAAQQAVEESNQIKNAFLASMNHELRTPLNHIIGFSNLLEDAVDLEEAHSFAGVIKKSGEHLLQIFEDIFELTLAEHSMLHVNVREVDCFEHYIQNKSNLEEILRASGKEEDIKLIFSPDLDAYNRKIQLDTTKVNQVLSNLMRNAIKFTPKGSIEFGFEFVDPHLIRYFVIDTGIGIPEDKQKQIFEMFRQAEEGNTRPYGGVGIGLAICQRVTEIMGGKLRFRSEPDRGTSFNLELPCGSPEQAINIGDHLSHELISEMTDKIILLVEDDRVSALVLQRLLERFGASTLVAVNGWEAIQICKANPKIDLVLMDKIMPVMGGVEAANQIKKLYPQLPIIAITAGFLGNETSKSEDDVFDAIITKPINQDLLYREIRRFLNKNRF